MITSIIKCDHCEGIINNNKQIHYTVKWEDKYFQHTTKMTLCKKCANKFQANWIHCKIKE